MDTQLDDEVLAGLAALAPEDDPGELRRQAANLDATASASIALPAQMFLEAAQKVARAQILEQRALAVEAVRVASEDVAAREAAYEAAAKPERHRADMAMDALRAVQDRQRELVQAALDDEDNDALTKRRKILGYAEEVLALQDAKLAEVMQAREAARQDLDAVLEKRREARRELQRIEDSLAQPLAADIGAWAHFQALFFSWPYRLAAAKWGFGPPLSQGEENAGRLLAGLYADFAGVIPDGAARKVREMDQGQHAKSTANALNSMTIPMGDGRQMNVGQLLGLSSGLAGR